MLKMDKYFFQKLPVNEERQKAWIHAVSKQRKRRFFEEPKHFKVAV